MRILIVEDDVALAEELERRIRASIDPASVTRATSLLDATLAIESGVFDAAIVDLRLPQEPGGSDPSIEFGKAVEARLSDRQPGAARVFLTASDIREVKQQLLMTNSGDFFVTDEVVALVDHIQKEGTAELDECVSFIARHNERLRSLDEVQLTGVDEFDGDDRRALALTVRIVGGVRGQVLRDRRAFV